MMERNKRTGSQKNLDGGTFPGDRQKISRRAILTKATSLIGLAVVQGFLPKSLAIAKDSPKDPAKVPGALPRPYGKRSSFESAFRSTNATRSLTPLQDLHGMITPSAVHFERHHNGVPAIDPQHHHLLVHGLVKQPKIFSMNDIKQFPAVTRLAFIECSGNSAREWTGPNGSTVQDTHGLTSNSEWTGVRLATVVHEVGIRPEASWILAEGSDAAALTRSVPLNSIMDEALLCYAQNGEPLRPEQGYPLRLLLPGWEGNTCVKWLRRLKLMSSPAMTREETSKYTDLMPDGTARQFTFVMEAKSVITSPSGGQRLEKPGYVEIRGLAWSGHGSVRRVEVSTDGGHTWQPAQLQEPILPKCHTRFRLDWWWNGKEAILQSRCLDDTGYEQPTRENLLAVRGPHSLYHYNGIHRWKVTKKGMVENA